MLRLESMAWRTCCSADCGRLGDFGGDTRSARKRCAEFIGVAPPRSACAQMRENAMLPPAKRHRS